MRYKKFIKPCLDFILALILIVILSPLLIAITTALFAYNRGTPFFVQLRPGLHERIFRLYKFRTMTSEKDSQGSLLSDRDRLTVLGRLIRKYSLDELPQLINVLKGEMSLVGPRPLLIEYLSHYNSFQRRRHLLKPGITGWAQVNGRKEISWKRRFELDDYYIDHCSFYLDLKILWFTLFTVFHTDSGQSSENKTAMNIFE